MWQHCKQIGANYNIKCMVILWQVMYLDEFSTKHACYHSLPTDTVTQYETGLDRCGYFPALHRQIKINKPFALDLNKPMLNCLLVIMSKAIVKNCF